MGKITQIKNTRRQIRKNQQVLAMHIIKDIYQQKWYYRLIIAINIIFKRDTG